jgi:hypothetical protein
MIVIPSENMEILNGVSALYPGVENLLQIEVLKAFAVQMKADLRLLLESLPFKPAFPTIMSLVIAAMTIPVSSTTCERTFSRMKLIKTHVRNTMIDIRLSDLCILSLEHDFNINFGKLVDNFADVHQNSRILLK